jgi:hypothetical protein
MRDKKSNSWSPTTRNRNIGTDSRGYKHRNSFAIPRSRHINKAYWEKLEKPIKIPCALGAHQFNILVEPPLPGFRHHTTVDDLIRILEHIPEDDRADISSIVLRQSKRKERIFSLTWGRLAYWAEYDDSQGPAILLEAQPKYFQARWSKRLSILDRLELERLSLEGHQIVSDTRFYKIRSDPRAIRNTQLFRTLLHELGHYYDYIEKVLIPSNDNTGDFDELFDLYHSRSRREKENFAERYVSRMTSQLSAQGIIPFDPINPECLGYDELNREWFAASA